MRDNQREFMRIMERFRRHRVHDLVPDMNHGEWHVMAAMAHCEKCAEDGAVRVSALVKRMKIPAPAVSRDLKHLEEKGLLQRHTDPKDRRSTIVVFTELGRQKSEEAGRAIRDYCDAVFERMGQEEMDVLLASLSRLEQIATEELEKRGVESSKEVHTCGN